VDTGIRASAAVGLGAFALSVIVAIFSRIPLGSLLLRAFLLGVAFAALAFGIQYILRKFLPELFDGYRPAEAGDAIPESGSMVDITVQDGDASQDAFIPRPLGGDAHGDARGDALSSPLGPAGGPESATDEREMEELEREVEDIRSEGLLPQDAQADGSRDRPVRPSVALDELDVLPDMDGMSDSFASDIVQSNGPGGDDPAGTASVTAGSGSGDADPAALAKAVQTLLRRDQKG